MPVDKFGRMSDTKTKDTGVSLTYINNNYIRSDGSTPVSGSINMNGNTLFNLPNPENIQDAATKKYVDNLIAETVGKGNISGRGSPFFKENDNFKATYAIDMGFKKLSNLSIPSEPSDAATKKYVDNIKSILNESINSLSQSYNTLDKTQEENKKNYIQSVGSTPVTGSIDMKGNTLYNVGEPKKSQDVATKDYADYIKASTQDYVDYRVKDIRKHVIAVYSSYTGHYVKAISNFLSAVWVKVLMLPQIGKF